MSFKSFFEMNYSIGRFALKAIGYLFLGYVILNALGDSAWIVLLIAAIVIIFVVVLAIIYLANDH